jgi:hypothetical protein
MAVIEEWSFRLNLSDPGGTNQNFSQSAAEDYANDVELFFGQGVLNITSIAMLTEVKLARIGPDGKYLADPFIVTKAKRGDGTSTLTHPTQVALAVSLGTDRRGSSGRGRFYLPGVQFGLDAASGTIAASAATAVRDAVVTFIQNLNNPAGINDPGTAKVTIASTKGFNSDVTSVRVGRALDTIRSRRTSLNEAYGLPVAI